MTGDNRRPVDPEQRESSEHGKSLRISGERSSRGRAPEAGQVGGQQPAGGGQRVEYPAPISARAAQAVEEQHRITGAEHAHPEAGADRVAGGG